MSPQLATDIAAAVAVAERPIPLDVDDERERRTETALRLVRAGTPVVGTCWTDDEGACAAPGKWHGADCEKPGKVALEGWKGDDALTTARAVRAFWKRFPLANVARRMDNAIGLDFDGPKAREVRRKWQRRTGKKLHLTWAQLTGRPEGGMHAIYAANGHDVSDLSTNNHKLGIDIKASHKSIMVVDPSEHASGRRYRAWRGASGSAEATDAVIDFARWIKYGDGDGDGADIIKLDDKRRKREPIGEPAGEGGRDVQLTRVAGKLVREHDDDLDFARTLFDAFAAQQTPPLRDAQIDKVWQSILGREQSKRAFFDGRRFIPKRVADHIATTTPIARGYDDRLYRYVGGVWLGDGDDYVKAQVRELLGDDHLKRHQSEVLAYFGAAMPHIRAKASTQWLNVRNGMLDWRTGQLRPHDPSDYSVAQIPVAWDPEADCPTIDQFLERILPDRDTVEFGYELVGYPLAQSNWLRKAALLLGPGGNGKTSLLRLLMALYGGGANVSSIPLQTLSENRFSIADLFSKLANVCGDLDARAVRQSDVFKMWTGLDALTGERKYGHAFNFVAHAVPIFSANEPPMSSDQSDAWFQRWLVVPMDKDLENAPDKIAPAKLHAALTAELPGLLRRSIEALRRLEERGHFELPNAVKAAMTDYRARLDSVLAFVEECCAIELGEGWERRSSIYAAYDAWCKRNGRHALNSASFYRRIEWDYGHAVAPAIRRGSRGLSGIQLRLGGGQ